MNPHFDWMRPGARAVASLAAALAAACWLAGPVHAQGTAQGATDTSANATTPAAIDPAALLENRDGAALRPPASTPEPGAAAAAAPASENKPAEAPAADTPRVRIEAAPAGQRQDLWQRIRNGFAVPDLQGERVRKWEQYYAGKPDYVQRMTARGARYLFHIVEEVEKRGMPLDLALLPFAESAFNPQASSSAKASGIWQFMPATGKDFALRQNLFRDDRRDVLASTRAALDYLQRLHKLLGGDWQLALAAYNWGQGNVMRAVSINRSAGKSTAYEHLQMPDETRNYIPKLQAIKNLVMAPESLGLQLPQLDNHPYFMSVNIERDIDVSRAASMAGLTLDEFQALNPQMNKPVILAAGTPQVLLPYDNANRFVQELAASRTPLASWTAWVAPRTLKPADAARQVGMDEARLREVNHIPDRMLVKAGSTLLVPRSGKVTQDVTGHVAENASIGFAPEPRPMRRVSFKAGKRGDSVAAVAQRYGVSPQAVAAWNKAGTNAHFKAGQVVVVMLPASTSRVALAAAAAVPGAAHGAAPGTRKASAKGKGAAQHPEAAKGPAKALAKARVGSKARVAAAAAPQPNKLRVRAVVNTKAKPAARRA